MKTKKEVANPLAEVLNAVADAIAGAKVDIAGQRITDPGFELNHIARAIAKAIKDKANSL